MIRYNRFHIEKYKAIKDSSASVLDEPIPLIGVNESGKSSALEAIARFDYRNDTIADQKKWKFLNRYMPDEKTFSVVAEVTVDSSADIETIVGAYPEAEKEEILAALQTTIENQKFFLKRIFGKTEAGLSVKYSIGENESPVIEKFSRDLVAHLPRIFYFDNFLEDPFPDKVEFPAGYFSTQSYTLTEYQSIVEGMFAEAGINLKNFLNETDDNTKQTQILEVNRITTQALMAEWTAMHVSNTELDIGNMADLQIDLQQDRVNTHAIDINILEKFIDEGNISRTTSMLLSERSLGFRWFFNFSAKKSYGARGENKFIYLFDEPGSYLHNGAQGILLKAIRDLAKSHPVIFSTHSEFLLDPEIINVNNVRILEKNDRQIKLVPFAEFKEKKTMGALSTLYNALRMKVPISSTINQKIIITEGITDFYFWKMQSKELIILPGLGAGQNEYLISIAIGTSKKYIAWFDGDVAGQQAIQKYTRFFGDMEKEHWKKYIKADGSETKLEQILSQTDQQRLNSLTNSKDLKRAITSLYFSKDKNAYWNGIDSETKSNINANIKVLEAELNLKIKLSY
jgi:hypothetical protein